jgi:hypothetical protein
MRAKDRRTFYCFSPPVMIATFIIEISLAIYTLWRYKFTPIIRLASLLLVFLAIFQLAEFMVCRNIGGDSLLWSRVGFASITMLPPLGIHALYAIVRAKERPLLWVAYLMAAAFVAFFALVGHAFDGHSCLGNYVIFQLAPGSGWLFGAYYYGLLLATLLLGWRYLRTVRKATVKRAVSGLMLGYAIFLIPTATVHMLSPASLTAIPSVMCGFAVLLALALCFIVLPVAGEKK